MERSSSTIKLLTQGLGRRLAILGILIYSLIVWIPAGPAFSAVSKVATPKKSTVCTPTKGMKVASKPIMSDIANTDNNATKDSGDFEDLYLNKVMLRGVIKDRNCIPVPNATLEIWQEDEYGKERYNKLSLSFTDRYALNREQYSKFLGIATATSDNNGQFTFITVLPDGKLNKNTIAYINVSARHRDFPLLETKLVIRQKSGVKMPKDSLVGYRNMEAEQVYMMPTYDVEIVLNGRNRYKTY